MENKNNKTPVNAEHPLAPVLEAHLQSTHENADQQNKLLELGIEATSKAGDKIAESIKELKPAMENQGKAADFVTSFLTAIKGDKGDTGATGAPGKDSDEQKIIESVSSKLPKKEDIISEVVPAVLEKVPKIDDIVAQVIPKIEPGKDGENGTDGQDASPDEVASILKKDKSFIEKTKGDEGKKGERGEDGSSDTAEEIIRKISELKKPESADEEDKRLSFKALKDVPESFGRRQGVGYLQDLANVNIPTDPVDGQVLTYSASRKAWVASTIVSSSTGTWFQDEVLTRTNGINYTLAHTPIAVVFLYLNGQLLVSGTDYTRTGAAIVMTSATLSSDVLSATYL